MNEKIESLKAYQDKHFIYINNYLRNKTYVNNDNDFLLKYLYYTEKILNNTKKHIENLDALFADADKINDETIVYRGSEYMNEGICSSFVSTSKSLSVAKKYAKNKYLYELHLNKNIPYIDINTWSNDEEEILLPRGLNLNIKKIINKKHYVIDVNLLNT